MTVYKYLPSEDYALSILKTGLIAFSPVTAFNDPFELSPNIDLIDNEKTIKKKHLQRVEQLIPHRFGPTTQKETNKILSKLNIQSKKGVLNDLKFVQNQVNNLIVNHIDYLRNNIGILSLTKTPDNLLMWSHYAKNHTGLVIGFDENHWYFNQQDNVQNKDLFNLKKVIYSPNRPSITEQFEIDSFDTLMTKSPEWSYEKEVRMLALLEHSDEQIDSHQLFQIPFNAFTKIIIGNNATQDFKESILLSIKENPKLQHVNIMQTQLSKSKFNIYFESLIAEGCNNLPSN